ncbi:hypothetical protein LXL04_009598 [Taraxacum kok-saghyz]
MYISWSSSSDDEIVDRAVEAPIVKHNRLRLGYNENDIYCVVGIWITDARGRNLKPTNFLHLGNEKEVEAMKRIHVTPKNNSDNDSSTRKYLDFNIIKNNTVDQADTGSNTCIGRYGDMKERDFDELIGFFLTQRLKTGLSSKMRSLKLYSPPADPCGLSSFKQRLDDEPLPVLLGEKVALEYSVTMA